MSAPSGSPKPEDAVLSPHLAEHYFRREYAQLVAVLVRRVGLHHLEAVEDAVQSALMTALTAWVADGVPRDPGAWLYRVALNGLLGVLRKDKGREDILRSAANQDDNGDEPDASPAFAGEVLVFTPKPASPPSIALLLHSTRPAGRRSRNSMPCSSGSTHRPFTRSTGRSP